MQRVCAFFFNCATLKRINGRLGIDGRLSSWSRNQGDLLGLFSFYISHLIDSPGFFFGFTEFPLRHVNTEPYAPCFLYRAIISPSLSYPLPPFLCRKPRCWLTVSTENVLNTLVRFSVQDGISSVRYHLVAMWPLHSEMHSSCVYRHVCKAKMKRCILATNR